MPTWECLDTQCLSTFRTRLVAALRITNSLSPFLWSVGKPETARGPSARAHSPSRAAQGAPPSPAAVSGGTGTPGATPELHIPRAELCPGSLEQALGALPARRETPLGTMGTPQVSPGQVPALARDILRYFSLVGVPSLAPAVAMAKAEVADRALRAPSRSRQDVITIPLL